MELELCRKSLSLVKPSCSEWYLTTTAMMKAGVSVSLCIQVPAPLVPVSLPWGDHPHAMPEPSSGHTGEMLLGKVESTDDTVRSRDSALKA